MDKMSLEKFLGMLTLDKGLRVAFAANPGTVLDNVGFLGDEERTFLSDGDLLKRLVNPDYGEAPAPEILWGS